MSPEQGKREVTVNGGRSCGAWLATVRTLAFTQGKMEPWEGSQQRRDGSDWVPLALTNPLLCPRWKPISTRNRSLVMCVPSVSEK